MSEPSVRDIATVSTVALVGSPNAGKTTLYNWLTGSRFKTVNYPGATVEYAMGISAERLGPPRLQMMDTPGTYSLFPRSQDERVTADAIYNVQGVAKVDRLIVVVDGTQLQRHLVLVQQLQAAGFRFVLAVTMVDLLAHSGVTLDLDVLRKALDVPVIGFDGLTGVGLETLFQEVSRLETRQPERIAAWAEKDFVYASERAKSIAMLAHRDRQSARVIYDQTAKIDRWILHPVLGLPLFLAVMTLLFSSIFWLAQPFMNLISESVDSLVGWILAQAPGALWADFIGHGLITSFGAVLVFVPQIFILSFGIGLLESSGYLARAATLIDQPFAKLGLSGRSFVPLLSGFACAVPAMMATRNISSKRDRLITNFIIPLMTCSARLPVYALLLSFLFVDQAPWKPGLVLAGLYLLSLVIGGFAAALLNLFLPKKETSFFMMELPLYRQPQWRVLLSQSAQKMQSYLVRAGPAIFAFSVVIWLGTTFPHSEMTTRGERLENSYFAQVGHFAEPVFGPMKVDWRVGVGLMSAFAAREVFVSSMALVFHVSEDEKQGLLEALKEAKLPNGQPLLTVGSVTGLILFFMIALQCMSTFAVSAKENGNWWVPISQLVAFNLLGYVLAVLAAQVLSA